MRYNILIKEKRQQTKYFLKKSEHKTNKQVQSKKLQI